MNPELCIFYVLSVLLIGFALIVVTSRNLFRGAMSLTAALGVMAGLFALLGGDFIAASQLLIYVGGVMVLLIFVVMFVQTPEIFRARQTGKRWLPALILGVSVAGILIRAFQRAPLYAVSTITDPMMPTSSRLGYLLLGDMSVPFEVISLILLAALVGALVFGLEREK
jgi:NADH:ubiquinone oxidoreductase subunit 6 (subunit J)